MLYLSPFITVYCSALAALFGVCMGSFLNCMAWRIVHGESVLKGRSHCDVCGHVLTVPELIPVFSYLRSKGKCRWCGAELSKGHLLAEIVSGLVFLTLLLKYDISLRLLEYSLFACVLLACSFADLEGYIIPDRFIIFGAAVRVVFVLLDEDIVPTAVDSAIGGVGIALVLLLVVLAVEKFMGREAMGGGDIKLIFVTGLYLGWKRNILCLILACVLGVMMYAKYLNKAERGSK